MELKNGAYENLVVKIQDNVPQEKCTQILENLEVRNLTIFFINQFRHQKFYPYVIAAKYYIHFLK